MNRFGWSVMCAAALLVLSQGAMSHAEEQGVDQLGDNLQQRPGKKRKPRNPNKPGNNPQLQGPQAQENDFGVAGARYLNVSPSGKELAFSLHGDLWVVPVDGGRAQRLTLNEANDVKPVWSPDGKRIAFTSDRSGSFDVWIMNADGGVPTRLTYSDAIDHVNAFTPDGKSVIFQSSRNLNWSIYSVSINGGTPAVLVEDSPSTAAQMCEADGKVYYQFAASDRKVKGYRGSANDELYRCLPGEIPERLTDNDQNDREPNVSPDGLSLYFTRETGPAHRSYNLFVMDLETQQETQLTQLDSDGMSNLAFDANFTKAYFVWRFRVYSIDLYGRERIPSLVKIDIVEDTRREKVVERTRTSGADNIDLSADGQWIAFSMGGAIWVMPSSGGQAQQVTATGSGDTAPRFSPDGQNLAFFSALRTGNNDIFVMNLQNRAMRRVTNHDAPDHFHNWSHDGSYLVFASDRAGKRDIWKVALDGSAPVQLTNTPLSDDDPSVSPDGSLIAFDSQRTGNADLYLMNADGSGVRRLYGTTAHEESPRFSPDGKLLVFNRTSQNYALRTVVVTDINGSGEVEIGEGSGGVFTNDGEHILYVNNNGEIKTAPAPTSLAGGRTIPFIAVERAKQSDQFVRAFEEGWRMVAQNFYVADFHGVDWQAVYAKYLPMIQQCQTRMEFYHYMTEMVGELSASHQGVSGQITDVPGFATGSLGALLVPETMASEDNKQGGASFVRLRVVDPETGGPLDSAWIRDGDYIFGIQGQRLTKHSNFFEKLNGTVGQEVQLFVGTQADGSDMRAVAVKPEHLGQAQQRRYQDWVATCKETTHEESDGSVAYIHIPAMMPPALRAFENELGSPEVQAAKALVLDVRNNGGGNIHQQLLDILSRKRYATNFNRQNPQGGPTPTLYWDRPIVLLINEKSYSDAEVFPHAFKTLKLGTIVGMPTPGAVIGTNDITLSDGSRFRITRLGFRNLDGTNQEGNGCQPHVLVEETAEDRLLGRDVQLLRAVEIALDKVSSSTGSGINPHRPAEGTPTAGDDDGEDFADTQSDQAALE